MDRKRPQRPGWRHKSQVDRRGSKAALCFDAADSKDTSGAICGGIPAIQLSEEEAGSCLSRIKAHKADSSVRLTLFNTCTVTSMWRSSSGARTAGECLHLRMASKQLERLSEDTGIHD